MFVSPPEKKPTKERKNIHKQVYLTPVSTLVKPTAKNMEPHIHRIIIIDNFRSLWLLHSNNY